MLNIERVLKQDRLLRALTDLNRKAFEALLVVFSPCTSKRTKLNRISVPWVEDGKLGYWVAKRSYFSFCSTPTAIPLLMWLALSSICTAIS